VGESLASRWPYTLKERAGCVLLPRVGRDYHFFLCVLDRVNRGVAEYSGCLKRRAAFAGSLRVTILFLEFRSEKSDAADPARFRGN